jgi:hypothetical protein
MKVDLRVSSVRICVYMEELYQLVDMDVQKAIQDEILELPEINEAGMNMCGNYYIIETSMDEMNQDLISSKVKVAEILGKYNINVGKS